MKMKSGPESGLRIGKTPPAGPSGWLVRLYRAALALVLFFALGAAFCSALLPEDAGTPLWGALLGAAVCAALSLVENGRIRRLMGLLLPALLLLTAAAFSRRVTDGLCLCWNAWCARRTAVTGKLHLGLRVLSAQEAQSGCVTLTLTLLGAALGGLCAAGFRRLPAACAGVCIACAAALALLLDTQYGLTAIFLLLAAGALLLAADHGRTLASAPPAAAVLLAAGLMLAILMQIPAVRSGSLFADLRAGTQRWMHVRRYEVQTQLLPEGDFTALSGIGGETTRLTVQMEHAEPMYLRGFVGQDYTGSGWAALSPRTLAGESSLLYWLHTGGFYPQTQTGAAASALADGTQETGLVTVRNAAACARYLYVPYMAVSGSFSQTLTAARLEEAMLLPENGSVVSFRILSGAPEKTADWVERLQSPQTPEEEAYLTLESGYRQFVEAYDLALSDETRAVLSPYLDRIASGYPDGEITPLTAVRCTQDFLSEVLTYAEEAPALPDGADFVTYTLKNGTGRDFQYATLAVLALRYYGVPARYAEGYILTQERAAEAESGLAELTDADAHAWAEVYQEGIGWLPLEMTPGYADAMGSAPQAGTLAAGLSDRTDSESSVGTAAGDGSGAYISEGSSYEPEPEQDADSSDENGDSPDQSHTERTRMQRLRLLLWILIPILLLAAACTYLVLRRRSILKKRQAQLEADDPNEAASWRFAYGLRLLEQLGLSCGGGSTFPLADAAGAALGADYGEQLRRAAYINQKAMFSTHTVTDEEREEMAELCGRTAALLKEKSKLPARLRQRWLQCLY